MAKSNRAKVTPPEFFKYYLEKTGIPDPRDAKDSLDVLLVLQKIYGSILETIGMLSLLISQDGLISFTLSPHFLVSPERIDMVLAALEEVKKLLEEAKKKEATETQ